ALHTLGLARAAGDHVDHAGRGVLAEHRALRALEHLDPLDLAQVAEADAVTRPVHAVDDDTHRRLQADVVADRADAADARGGDRLALGAGDGQAGHQDLHVLDVAHAGVLQQLLVQRGYRDRHVLQRFLALLRGHREGGQGLRFVLPLPLRGLLGERRHGQGGDRREHRDGQGIALWMACSHVWSPPMMNGKTWIRRSPLARTPGLGTDRPAWGDWPLSVMTVANENLTQIPGLGRAVRASCARRSGRRPPEATAVATLPPRSPAPLSTAAPHRRTIASVNARPPPYDRPPPPNPPAGTRAWPRTGNGAWARSRRCVGCWRRSAPTAWPCSPTTSTATCSTTPAPPATSARNRCANGSSRPCSAGCATCWPPASGTWTPCTPSSSTSATYTPASGSRWTWSTAAAACSKTDCARRSVPGPTAKPRRWRRSKRSTACSTSPSRP